MRQALNIARLECNSRRLNTACEQCFVLFSLMFWSRFLFKQQIRGKNFQPFQKT